MNDDDNNDSYFIVQARDQELIRMLSNDNNNNNNNNPELTKKGRELMLRLSKLYLEPDYNKFRAECSNILAEALTFNTNR